MTQRGSPPRSCVECRRRKIRRKWSDGSASCDHCVGRSKTCTPQALGALCATSQTVQGSSTRERLAVLEGQISALSNLVRANHEHALANASIQHEDTRALSAGPSDDHALEHTADVAPPTHLRLIFHDLDAGDNHADDLERQRRAATVQTAYSAQALERLRPLLPSRAAVAKIAVHASDWMTLYHDLFPAFFTVRSGDQVVNNYDHMCSTDVQPVPLAMYLLSLGISAQQVPQSHLPVSMQTVQKVKSFVDQICYTVKQTIIDNDVLAATVEGLETCMLFIRL